MSKITPGGAVTTTFATVGTFPVSIVIDSVGNLYTVNQGSDTVSKITPGGLVTTFATVGGHPAAITIDQSGNLYTANNSTNNVSKIEPDGTTTVIFAAVGLDPIANTTVSVKFTAGASGGSQTTNMQYSLNGGSTWVLRNPASENSPIIITGLKNATTYQLKLRAVSSIGAGAPSAPLSVTAGPAKASVKWSSSSRKRTVTVVITPVSGLSYSFSAKSGRKLKTGTCKNVRVKVGKKKVARRSCMVELTKGTWVASVTPKWKAIGAADERTFKFK